MQVFCLLLHWPFPHQNCHAFLESPKIVTAYFGRPQLFSMYLVYKSISSHETLTSLCPLLSKNVLHHLLRNGVSQFYKYPFRAKLFFTTLKNVIPGISDNMKGSRASIATIICYSEILSRKSALVAMSHILPRHLLHYTSQLLLFSQKINITGQDL